MKLYSNALRGLVVFSFSSLLAIAAQATPPDSGEASESIPSQTKEEAQTIELETVVVEEDKVPAGATLLNKEDLQGNQELNIGESIERIPGVHAVRRSASATEPVIRGLGWERVATQMNFMPIHGACPARMDPPVTYAKPSSADEVLLIKGIPSVTLGSGGPGGRVMVRKGMSKTYRSEKDLGAWTNFGFDGARNGVMGDLGMRLERDRYDLELSLEGSRTGDYKSASGLEVPSSQTGMGASAAVNYKPGLDQRVWSEFSFTRDQDIDFPSLPMDTRYGNSYLYLGRYQQEKISPLFENLELDFGFSYVDHQMDNENKPNRGVLEASTDSKSQTFSLRGLSGLRIREASLFNLGLDLSYLLRDAVRTRTMVASGMTAQDHLWPDAAQWNLGLFSEWNEELSQKVSLRIGGRFDLTRSTAGAVGDGSLMGRTIAENYAAFNGSSNGDIDRFEYTGSGNVRLAYSFKPDFQIYTGGGITSRPSSITERYFAFAPAPGGFQIGNPALAAEKKYEFEIGFSAKKRWIRFDASTYAHWVDDYVVTTGLATQDVNGDGNPDLIRGFENVWARLIGFESGLTFQPMRQLTFPLTLSYVRGQNLTDNTNLPEIPPFEGRIAARWEESRGFGYFGEIGMRFVAAQSQVDPNFPEDTTDSFETVNLKGGISPLDSFHIELGIENLLDRNYNEHLTREALLAAGDLNPGDEVFAPGRSFTMNLRYVY